MLRSGDDVPVATQPRPDDPDAVSLVRAFEDVLQHVDALPPVVMVPCTYRRRGFRRYVHSLPRPRPLLRLFVVDHARKTLDVVRRRLSAVAALEPDNERAQEQAECVTRYMESLPRYGRVLYSTSLALLTVVVTRFVLLATPGAILLFGNEATGRQGAEIDAILQMIQDANFSLVSLDDFLFALRDTPLAVAFIVTSLVTVLYVELRLFVPSFRLKRSLFNLYPQLQLVSVTPARSSVQRATGLYDLERSVTSRLSGRPTREAPFDLIVPALLMPLLLFLAGLMIYAGTARAVAGDPLLSYSIASAIIAGVMARLGWLTRAWLRRLRPYTGPHFPSEVGIRRGELIVALRDPLTIFWATAVAAMFCVGLGVALSESPMQVTDVRPVDFARLLMLAFVVAPLWYRMNRDVTAYLQIHGAPRPGRPPLSLLAMVAGGVIVQQNFVLFLVATGLVLVSVYRTCRRVQQVEVTAGLRDTTLLPPVLLVVGFVLFPLVLAHIQWALNAAWRSDGDVLD